MNTPTDSTPADVLDALRMQINEALADSATCDGEPPRRAPRERPCPRARVRRRRAVEFASLNGWTWQETAPSGPAWPVGVGDDPALRNGEWFYDGAGVVVCVVAFPVLGVGTVENWAASVGLVAHVMPPAGKYWPQVGALRPDTPLTVAYTRPGTPPPAWPVDSAPADWSADSEEFLAEIGRLEAELAGSPNDDDTTPTDCTLIHSGSSDHAGEAAEGRASSDEPTEEET